MKKIMFAMVAFAILTSCGNTGKEPSEAAQKHSSWIESLEDSVKNLQSEMERINAEIDMNKNRVDSLLPMFDVIDNPRYVEKYSVYKGWKNYDTGSKTGVLIRLCENATLEMIATWQGGFFDHVNLLAEGETVSTGVVPYDKALNYRIGSTNIVAFKGKEVNDICRLVSDNESADVKMTFVGNKSQKTIVLTKTQKEMIAATFRLWNCSNEVNLGNMRLQLLAEKMKIFETHIQKSKINDEETKN